MNARAFAIHYARVHLAEAARRRHSWVNRKFYWTLIAAAQKARRRAESLTVRDLFGVVNP